MGIVIRIDPPSRTLSRARDTLSEACAFVPEGSRDTLIRG